MPKQSERKKLIKFLEDKLIVDACLYESGDSDDDYDTTLEFLAHVQEHRYLRQRSNVPKIDINIRFDLLQALDDNRVRQEIRMSLFSFNALHDKIVDHYIYATHEKQRRTEVKIQMMLALERIGCFGNGTSVGKLARSIGISGMSFIMLV